MAALSGFLRGFTNPGMNYRRLGEAGVKLSEIGLGGWLTFNAIGADAGACGDGQGV